MDYNDAMKFILSASEFATKEGLERIRCLLEHMGNPQRELKYVHVAGTNGKGSVVSFISNILVEAGYKTGLFISPYIHRFNERISVNGREISDEALVRITYMIQEKVELMQKLEQGHPTTFEVTTALGFQYYYEMGCDIVVLETGLGGRLDSTNIIEASEVSVITAIDYDHMSILGNTLPKIAAEKAGIIKEKGSIVMYPQVKAVEEVIEQVCAEKNARISKLDKTAVSLIDYNINRQRFDFAGHSSLELSLLPEFQTLNAAAAVMAVELLGHRGYRITSDNIRNGLANTRWPGRFEVMYREPMFIVDGAHNPQGAAHLAANLKRYFPGKEITFIIGMMGDKDYTRVIDYLAPLAKRFIAVQIASPRALDAEKLAAHLRTVCMDVQIEKKPSEAVKKVLNICCDDEVICSMGSLYHVGEVRETLSRSKSVERISHLW